MILAIAFIAALAWVIKDCIKAKSLEPIKTNWKKYVGCMVAGLIYGYLQKVSLFRDISVFAVIYLVGNSFSEVLTAINWVYSKITRKKA